MSYTRTFTKAIPVSGTVTVSYPASSHGGVKTASYSELVPVTVKVFVNTDAFDQSVDKAALSTDGLTGAVTAMDLAQRQEIEQSGKKIAKKLTDGFYGLISNDLTMQKASEKTVLQAKFALLMNLSKDMKQKHERVNDDLAKLQRHYAKIFDNLNDELKKRLSRLDDKAFYLSDHIKQDVLVNPYVSSASANMISASETADLNHLIILGRTRDSIHKVMNRIGETVDMTRDFNASIASVLSPDSVGTIGKEYIPVVYCRDCDVSRAYVSQVDHEEEMVSAVQSHMDAAEEESWKTMDDETAARIEQPLMKMIEDDAAHSENSQRVYELMMKMWNHDKAVMKNV